MQSIRQVEEMYNPPSVELPNAIREQLLSLHRGKAALLLDACYFVGMKPGTKFTYNELWAQIEKFEMSPRMVRDTLSDPVFIDAGTRKPKRGRPSQVYALPSVSEVAARSGIGYRYQSPSDRLSPEAFKSLRAYRLELYYRLIEREPGLYSRALLSDRLGVSKRTTRSYDKALNLQVTPRTQVLEITLSYVGIIPVERPPKGKPRYQWLESTKDNVIVRGPLVRGLAVKWLAEGRPVWRVQQTTNHYAIANEYLQGKYAGLFDH